MGCSPDPQRDSNSVAAFLQARGKRVIPVNPQACPGEILGQTCHPDLASIGGTGASDLGGGDWDSENKEQGTPEEPANP